MTTKGRIGVACLLAAFLAFAAVGRPRPTVIKAHADILGASGSGVSGTARFKQHEEGFLSNVKIVVHVQGLAPNSVHGIHIHENGTCGTSGNFTEAGGHYDPGPNGNSSPDGNHPFHMGDIPNLEANKSGNAVLVHTTSRITLSPGPVSVFDGNGSAVIVHVNPDQGTTGVSGGAGGARLACGVIVPN